MASQPIRRLLHLHRRFRAEWSYELDAPVLAPEDLPALARERRLDGQCA